MISVLVSMLYMGVLPIVTMFLLRLLFPRMTFVVGYTNGVIIYITLFSIFVHLWSYHTLLFVIKPLRIMVLMTLIELMVYIFIVNIRNLKKKKKETINNSGSDNLKCFNLHKNNTKWEMFIWGVSCIGWMVGATCYIRYIPDNAILLMADINRVDFLEVTNGNPIVMLGYYLMKFMKMSSAKAVCVVIPLFFYFVFAFVMWDLSGALFKDCDFKRIVCFFSETFLLIIGDCMYTQPHIVLHGLNDIGNILLVLCVPLVFSNGIRLCQDERSKWKEYCFTPIVCMICTFLLDKRTFALVSINVIIFGLLFIGRRYLPWLQSTKL